MNEGDNIRRIRKEKGLTQSQLAKKAGISEISVRKYESGKRKPKLETMEKIANALDVPLDEILDHRSLLLQLMESLQISGDDENEILDDNTNEERPVITERYIIFELQKLNIDGQIRLLEHIEDLSKIPEYQKKED